MRFKIASGQAGAKQLLNKENSRAPLAQIFVTGDSRFLKKVNITKILIFYFEDVPKQNSCDNFKYDEVIAGR